MNSQKTLTADDKQHQLSLAHSPDLQYLNENYSYPVSATTSAPSLQDRLASLLGKCPSTTPGVYTAAERDFHAHLVRFLNEVALHLQRLEEDRIADRRTIENLLEKQGNNVLARAAEARDALQSNVQRHDSRLTTMESVVSGLESIIARLGKQRATATEADRSSVAKAGERDATGGLADADHSYLLLENRFRGGEKLIKDRLLHYVRLFQGLPGPILEIGSGRGELQELFRDAKVDSYGVELDASMAQVALDKGLQVLQTDGLRHLAGLADRSLGGIIAIQVVEHFDQQRLQQLLSLSLRKVVQGGKACFETINTASLLALCHNYFRDPTHVWPLHPDTMRYMMELAGFKVQAVERIAPYPAGAALQLVPQHEFMPPRWASAVEIMNRNFQQLNEVIYGFQDYYIIAEIP